MSLVPYLLAPPGLPPSCAFQQWIMLSTLGTRRNDNCIFIFLLYFFKIFNTQWLTFTGKRTSLYENGPLLASHLEQRKEIEHAPVSVPFKKWFLGVGWGWGWGWGSVPMSWVFAPWVSLTSIVIISISVSRWSVRVPLGTMPGEVFCLFHETCLNG